jgi:hypothetical protein
MIKDIINSIAQISFYRDVPEKSMGRTVGHIAVLALIYGLVSTIAVFVHLKPKIAENVEWLATNVPTLTLNNGRLKSVEPGRQMIEHPKIEGFVVVIDTDRESPVTSAEMQKEGFAVYLTAKAIYVFNPANNNFRAQELAQAKEVQNYDIGPEFYRNFAKAFTFALYPTALVLCAAWFFLFKLLAALVYSIVALMVNAAMDGGLEFPALYKISVYAMTPVIALQMVARLAKGPFLVMEPIPMFRLLAFILVGVYVWQAIRHIKPPAPEAPPAV